MNPLELNLGIVGIITIVVISHLSTKIRYLQENFEKLKRKVDELELKLGGEDCDHQESRHLRS